MCSTRVITNVLQCTRRSILPRRLTWISFPIIIFGVDLSLLVLVCCWGHDASRDLAAVKSLSSSEERRRRQYPNKWSPADRCLSLPGNQSCWGRAYACAIRMPLCHRTTLFTCCLATPDTTVASRTVNNWTQGFIAHAIRAITPRWLLATLCVPTLPECVTMGVFWPRRLGEELPSKLLHTPSLPGHRLGQLYIRKGRNGNEGSFLKQQWTSVLKVTQSRTNGQKKMARMHRPCAQSMRNKPKPWQSKNLLWSGCWCC